MVETLTCSRTFSVRLEMLDNEFCHRLKNQDISRKSTGKYPVYDATFYAYVQLSDLKGHHQTMAKRNRALHNRNV